MENLLLSEGRPACPWLPRPVKPMSWRDLRFARRRGPGAYFETACSYAAWLWLQAQPARAILALCRALYVEPRALPPGCLPPYKAYGWILAQHDGRGFLGNPRVSFQHQATRIPDSQRLKRQRAWALWHLTRRIRPELPADPRVPERAPAIDDLAALLDTLGLPNEGAHFRTALEDARPAAPQSHTPVTRAE